MIQAIHVAPKARGPWQIPTHVFGTVRASILLMVTMKNAEEARTPMFVFGRNLTDGFIVHAAR